MKCRDKRPCFARGKVGGPDDCAILSSGYPAGRRCPFCKPKREVTNGKVYPRAPYGEVSVAKKES